MSRVIRFIDKGGTKRTRQFISHAQELDVANLLHRYGTEGVRLLSEHTPRNTGLTARSWYYEIIRDQRTGVLTLAFNNSNKIGHTPIVRLVIYGHGTRQGVWIKPNDFVSPMIEPLFRNMAKDIWREVKKR